MNVQRVRINPEWDKRRGKMPVASMSAQFGNQEDRALMAAQEEVQSKTDVREGDTSFSV
jgi:hypothetical protein